jgi:hypothetical protein
MAEVSPSGYNGLDGHASAGIDGVLVEAKGLNS